MFPDFRPVTQGRLSNPQFWNLTPKNAMELSVPAFWIDKSTGLMQQFYDDDEQRGKARSAAAACQPDFGGNGFYLSGAI
jgi:hypothetical protein